MNIYRLLKDSRGFLTPQQYRTLKGQVTAGDITGAVKGLERLRNKRRNNYGPNHQSQNRRLR